MYFKIRILVLSTLILAVSASYVVAQGTASGSEWTWQKEQALDVAMGSLEGPVLQPINLPGEERGILRWPLYKQQPPAAQFDFRSLPAPDVPIGTDPTSIAPSLGPGDGTAAISGGGTDPGPPAAPPPSNSDLDPVEPPPPPVVVLPPETGLPPIVPGPFTPTLPTVQ